MNLRKSLAVAGPNRHRNIRFCLFESLPRTTQEKHGGQELRTSDLNDTWDPTG
jgi:hypothetical protein